MVFKVIEATARSTCCIFESQVFLFFSPFEIDPSIFIDFDRVKLSTVGRAFIVIEKVYALNFSDGRILLQHLLTICAIFLIILSATSSVDY